MLDDLIAASRTEVVAARLRMLRNALELDQNEFARRAGIAPQLLNNNERGRSRLSLDSAVRLVATYHVTLDFIYLDDMSNLPYKLAAVITAMRDLQQDTEET
jgi:transcriptional regulator with XRE-family HTH domain